MSRTWSFTWSLRGRGRTEREARGEAGARVSLPAVAFCLPWRKGAFVCCRDEVARPGRLADRGCVALLSFGGCFSVRAPALRALKDFAAPSSECQA